MNLPTRATLLALIFAAPISAHAAEVTFQVTLTQRSDCYTDYSNGGRACTVNQSFTPTTFTVVEQIDFQNGQVSPPHVSSSSAGSTTTESAWLGGMNRSLAFATPFDSEFTQQFFIGGYEGPQPDTSTFTTSYGQTQQVVEQNGATASSRDSAFLESTYFVAEKYLSDRHNMHRTVQISRSVADPAYLGGPEDLSTLDPYSLFAFLSGPSQITIDWGEVISYQSGYRDELGTVFTGTVTASVSAVPLPAGLWLMLSGMGGLWAAVRRRM